MAATALQDSFLFHSGNRRAVEACSVRVDDAGPRMRRISQRLAEQAFGRRGIAPPREHEVDRSASGIDGSVEVAPTAPDTNVRPCGAGRPSWTGPSTSGAIGKRFDAVFLQVVAGYRAQRRSWQVMTEHVGALLDEYPGPAAHDATSAHPPMPSPPPAIHVSGIRRHYSPHTAVDDLTGGDSQPPGRRNG